MDKQEVISFSWEFLAKKKIPLTVKQIADYSGQSNQSILGALGTLNQRNLVFLVDPKNQLYEANVSLTALEWAKAIQVGVSLFSLEQHCSLKSNQKDFKEMIRSGVLDNQIEEEYKVKKDKTEAELKGRAASKAAASEVAKFLTDAEEALKIREKIRRLRHGEKVDELLRIAKSQAEESLRALENQLFKDIKRGKC